jgi:hypothetical protein
VSEDGVLHSHRRENLKSQNRQSCFFNFFIYLFMVYLEQGAEENIWTKERWSDGKVEKAA